MADITPGASRRRKQRTSIIIAAIVAVIVVVAGVFVVRSLSGGAGAPTASASTNTGKDAAPGRRPGRQEAQRHHLVRHRGHLFAVLLP